jgi:hypothetical protein
LSTSRVFITTGTAGKAKKTAWGSTGGARRSSTASERSGSR